MNNDSNNLEVKDPKKIWHMARTPFVPVEKRKPSIGTIGRGFIFSNDEPLPHSGSEFVSYEDINPQQTN